MDFKPDKTKTYEENVKAYLEGMKDCQRCEIARLTSTPERFIAAVKRCIDSGMGTVSFTDDFRFIIKSTLDFDRGTPREIKPKNFKK